LEQRRANNTLPRWLIQSQLHYLFQIRLAGFDEVLAMALFSKAYTSRNSRTASLYFRVLNPSVSFSKIDGERHEPDMMAK
jgi:hypothetical protein